MQKQKGSFSKFTTNKFRMYKYLYFLAFALAPSLLSTQITIDSNTLPEVGDVLEYATFDGLADTTAFRQNGEDQTWIFADIDTDGPVVIEAYSDITGSGLDTLFPDANMLVELDMFPAAAIRDNNSIKVLGVGADGFAGGFLDIDIQADTRFDEPYVLRQTPINFGNSYDDSFSLQISFSTDSLGFFDSIPLPIPGASLDSLRITVNNSKRERATGWGKVDILGNEIEVLKVEINETSETGFDLGLSAFGFFTWLDASELFDTGDLFPQGETVTHRFMAADSKASIIEFTETTVQDSFGIETTVDGRVRADLVTSTENVLSFDDITMVFPQPANQSLTIMNRDNATPLGKIIIFNNGGQLMTQLTSNESQVSVNVDEYPSGIYTLMLVSEKGIIAKRITITDEQ